MDAGHGTASTRRLTPGHVELWVLGVVFFGVGDLLTTGVGLGVAGVSEANPVVAPIVELGDFVAMGALKALTFVCFFGLWKVVPRPHSVGIPLALAVVGLAVTLWNLHVLLVAGGAIEWSTLALG